MKNNEQTITLAEMTEALKRSGYLLEGRVFKALTKAGLHVHTNVGYPDPETGTSREIDVEAYAVFYDEKQDDVQVQLMMICECENNRNPIVFLETEGRQSYLHPQVTKCCGAPTKLWISDQWKPIDEALSFKRFHHYAKGPVATQYCGFTKPKDKEKDWVAQHPEHQHETFSKLSDAVTHFQVKRAAPFASNVPLNGEEACVVLFYPVLVMQGDLYLARGHRGSQRLSKVDRVQYRRHVSTSRSETTFQIDVVQESHLPDFVAMIFAEADQVLNWLLRHRPIVRRSLRRMLLESRSNGSLSASELR